MADKADVQVIHNEEQNRFEVEIDGKLAMVEYQKAGKNIIYTHTEVLPELGGQGIATAIVHEAMEYAKNNDLKVQALCPFVKKYVMENEEYHDITWGF